MIVLSAEELLAMNGLIDGVEIAGIKLTASEEAEEVRVAKLKKSFTEKEFLVDEKLSNKFMVTAKLLEYYKSSERKVFINNLRIGLTEDDYAVVLDILPSHEVSFSRVPRITVMKKYVEAAEFLRQGQKVSFFDYEKENFSEEEFELELDSEEWKDLIVVQKYRRKALTDFRTYYFNDKEAYCYDYKDKTRQQRGAKDFREDLLGILEIEVGEKAIWQ